MSPEPTTPDTPARGRRMTLSDVVEHLLQRGGAGQSSVTLSRNAKGETQLEVVVRTGDTGEVLTVHDAERVATEVYDRLAAKYAWGADAAGGAEKP